MPGDDLACASRSAPGRAGGPGRLAVRLRAAPALVTALLLQACTTGGAPEVRGVVWQPDAQTMDVHRAWDRLGAHELLIQWTRVDGADVFDAGPSCPAGVRAALRSVAGRPWARRVIVGLAGLRSESASRADVTALAEAGRDAAACGATPAKVSGWYFPVELDPTWSDHGVGGEPSDHRRALSRLPRPLWISVYDSANVGVEALIAQVRRAAPGDVGVLFQDGVGVEARTPAVARTYLDALARAFGRRRWPTAPTACGSTATTGGCMCGPATPSRSCG